MKLTEIRKSFLDYFRRNGHEVVASSSLIPERDPTLLFTNAGMNQFKDVFLGLEKRGYIRATTAQKCFRASGKHNDLENVGRTARHHTFFEMLGNFSFGDYFKRDAIRFAWEFLTVDMALPKDKLWITIFQDDDEAGKLWQEVAGVSPDRIIRLGEKDNFWSMGDTGPCGPCSEIHFDQGPKVGCGKPDCKVGCECDRHLELWNLVFMQFNRDSTGKLTPLPRPSIDTGMGIERIAAVKQGRQSNYDIDLFQDIIARAAEITGKKYGDNPQDDVSLRVIADHARAMAFLIADGILPSNEGRGYVLRRVMRRAGRHAKMLGRETPMLFEVVEKVIDLMGEAYHELPSKRSFITEVIKNEEERFLETLGSGLRILQEEMEKIGGQGAISGETAFKLYDTYGFPLDLTQTIAEEQGMTVDQAGFDRAMEAQRERAREHWKGSGEEAVDGALKKVRADSGPTAGLFYETTKAEAVVQALLVGGQPVAEVKGQGTEFALVVDRTPFYGESGGQVGDKGRVTGAGFAAEVIDTKKPLDDLFVHHCVLKEGRIAAGETVTMAVDEGLRRDTARNHSATHLLQAALRELLGDHVHQKGSLVTPDRFRFDLTHFSAVTAEQQRWLETRVNEMVRENLAVSVRLLPQKEAVAMGAMALFGEKYGETVRMVEMGSVSRELCGGTHTGRTGDVGLFKIVGESSVAAGVRRIEAVTGRSAVGLVQKMEDRLKEAADCFRANPDDLLDRIRKLQDEVKALKKGKQGAAGADAADLYAGMVEIGGVKVLVAEVQVSDPKEMRIIGDQVKDKLKSGVAVLGAKANGKATLLAVVTDDLTKKVSAGDIVKESAPVVGGKGGGRADFAQAGGPDVDKLGEALAAARRLISRKLD